MLLCLNSATTADNKRIFIGQIKKHYKNALIKIIIKNILFKRMSDFSYFLKLSNQQL